MVAVVSSIPPGSRARVVDAILARVEREPGVSARSRRVLLRAARRGRLVVARDGEAIVSWLLSESCGPGVHELGYFFVEPSHRSGPVFLEMVEVALEMRPRAIMVTMNARFADWLVRTGRFRRVGLVSIVCASRGLFLARRLAPRRFAEARRQTRSTEPIFLIHEKVSA